MTPRGNAVLVILALCLSCSRQVPPEAPLEAEPEKQSPAAPTATTEEPPPTQEPSSEAAVDAPRKPSAAALSRAVREHGTELQECFQRHVEQLGETRQVALRFQVDTGGRVIDAGLAPEALGDTPLGECLLDVAKSIPFPSQDKPISFRIPVTARLASDTPDR